jgi:hypothetical protein
LLDILTHICIYFTTKKKIFTRDEVMEKNFFYFLWPISLPIGGIGAGEVDKSVAL